MLTFGKCFLFCRLFTWKEKVIMWIHTPSYCSKLTLEQLKIQYLWTLNYIKQISVLISMNFPFGKMKKIIPFDSGFQFVPLMLIDIDITLSEYNIFVWHFLSYDVSFQNFWRGCSETKNGCFICLHFENWWKRFTIFHIHFSTTTFCVLVKIWSYMFLLLFLLQNCIMFWWHVCPFYFAVWLTPVWSSFTFL